jgi:hypothetical protein
MSIQPTINPPDNEKEFPSWVRNWIHNDKLVENLCKQVTNYRHQRDEYEEKIIRHLERRNMLNAVLQIQQGKYKVVNETHTNGLTLRNVEELLHRYFKVRGGGPSSDETEQIMSFIRQNRGQKVVRKLKGMRGNDATAPGQPA